MELLARQLEHEVRRETVAIAFNCLIEAKCGNTVDFRQIPIEHNAYSTNCVDHSVNLLDRD